MPVTALGTVSVALLGLGTLRRSGHLGVWLGVERSGVPVLRRLVIVKMKMINSDGIPEFLPGESHGQRSLVGCGPWGRKELDTTEAT